MSEKLQYMRFDHDRNELVIQLDGGGNAGIFPAGMPVSHVANGLRDLAARLERNEAARFAKRNAGEVDDARL